MDKVYFIFDYFKQAFRLNTANKVLYKPQIAFIVIQLLMVVGGGMGVYFWMKQFAFNIHKGQVEFMGLMKEAISFIIIVSLLIILYGIIAKMLEAGLYYMYYRCVTIGVTDINDFYQGVRKYFFKFLLADIVLALAWTGFGIFYVIFSIITLSIGFFVIPLIIGVFLTMWKVSIVANDVGIFRGLINSLKFAKRHFIPVGVLRLIHWSFARALNRSGTGNISNMHNTFEWRNPNNIEGMLNGNVQSNITLESSFDLEAVMRVVNIITAIFVPVISVAVVVAALVKMVFEVFFSLALFVAYQDDFTKGGAIDTIEEVVI